MTHKVFCPPAALHDDIAREHLPGMLRERGYRAIQLSTRYYADAVDANLVGAFDLANYRWKRLFVADGPPIETQGSPAVRFRDELTERLENRILHILDGREAPDAYRAVTTRLTERHRFWSDERRVSTLLEFIDTTPEPWFAHVHLNDTHDGVRPEEDYDAALRTADQRFRAIYEGLKARGQLDRTVIVISSDHGRRWTTIDRIPLMIRFPGAMHARVENRNVQLADVAPTILDYLGSPRPQWMDGVSLLRQDRLRHDRPIFAIAPLEPEGADGLFTVAQLQPPNYGAERATVIFGGQWLRLDIETGKTQVRSVEGHTAAEAAPRSAADARELLVRKLTDSGFRLGSSDKAQ
jgi:arylsulfatase A-like enzyme